MPIRLKDRSAGVITSSLPSEDQQLVRYDGTTGEMIEGAPVAVNDSGEFTRVGSGSISLFADADTTSITLGSSSINVVIDADTFTAGSDEGASNLLGQTIVIGSDPSSSTQAYPNFSAATSSSVSSGIVNGSKISMGWTPTVSGDVTQIELYLQRSTGSNLDADLSLYVYDDNAGDPNNIIYTSSNTINAQDLGEEGVDAVTLETFTFPASSSITSGTLYHVVLAGGSFTVAGNVRLYGDTNATVSEEAKFSIFGGSWSTTTSADVYLEPTITVTGSTQTTIKGKTINIGESGSTINMIGSVNNQQVTDLNVSDKLITLNDGGGVGSGNSVGIEVEENAVATGYIKTKSDRNGWQFLAPNQTGIATIELDSDNFTIDKTIVKGPTSGTDNKLLKSDGTNGRLIQESGITIDDSDNVSNVATLTTTADVDAVNVSASGKFETAETGNRALTTDINGDITASATTDTELGYVSGVTSAIQTQLDGKQTSTLTNGNVLIGNVSNEATSTDLTAVGDIEADTTNGLTIKAGAVDTDELATNAVTTTNITDANVTNAKIASGVDAAKISGGTVSNTEFDYLNGVTSAIQTQIDSKVTAPSSTDNAVARYDGASGAIQDSSVLISDTDEVTGMTKLTVDDLEMNGATIKNVSAGGITLQAANLNQLVSTVWGFYVGGKRQGAIGNLTTSGTSAVISTFGTSVQRLTNSGLVSIADIQAQSFSTVLYLMNVTGNDITLENNNAATANRTIITGTGTDFTLKDGASVVLVYDTTSSVWRISGGAAGTGSSGINHIDNADATSNVDGWAAYADAAAVSPADGTGGSPTTTITQNTTTPLRGEGDFVLTKDAHVSGRQGEGVSYDFTIDVADQGRISEISFDYKTSANYADDDIRVYVYDVTNSNLIEVSARDLKANSNYGRYVGYFQAAINSTSYRLILHISSINTSAYTVNFDNVRVGPLQTSAGGSYVSDLDTSWTPTGSWVTNTTYTGAYRKDGQYLDAEVLVETSGAPTSASLTIDLPSGLNIDTTALTSGTAFPQVGTAAIYDGTNTKLGVVLFNDTNTDQVEIYYSNDSSTFEVASAVNATSPVTFGAGDEIYIRFRAPIQGWETGLKPSAVGTNRDVKVVGEGNSGSALTADTERIDWTIVNDNSSSMSTTDNGPDTFTAPETATYKFSGSVRITSANTGNIKVYVNNSYKYQLGEQALSNVVKPFNVSLDLNKGDTVDFRISSGSTLQDDSNTHHLSITKDASVLSHISPTETIACRYTTDSGQTATAGTTVEYEDLDYDTHNAYNTSTGIYTVPASGRYLVSARFIPNTGNVDCEIGIEVNGTEVAVAKATNVSGLATAKACVETLDLIAGDTLEIVNAAGSSVTLSSVGVENTFSLIRIGL